MRYTQPQVYVAFDGKFYRITPQDWRDVCERGARGETIDYRAFGRPISQPWWVRTGDGNLTGLHRDHIIVSPQTWLPVDYVEASKTKEAAHAVG